MAQVNFLPYPKGTVNDTESSHTEGKSRGLAHYLLLESESDVDLAMHTGPLFLGLFTLLLTG